MARKSNNIRMAKDMSKAGASADRVLAKALLKIVAVGLAGGAATIAGSDKFGKKLVELREKKALKDAEQQEEYRQAVLDATANEVDVDVESE